MCASFSVPSSDDDDDDTDDDIDDDDDSDPDANATSSMSVALVLSTSASLVDLLLLPSAEHVSPPVFTADGHARDRA